MILSLFIEFQERLSVVALMYARILPVFIMMPILNSSVLSNTLIRNSVVFVIIIGIWPTVDSSLITSNFDTVNFIALILKELVVGASIGFLMALPFWIFNAVGSYIDMARGASMGSLLDPTNGQESTDLSNFINFCVCVFYLEMGGMRMLLDTLVQSYQHIGLNQMINININSIFLFLGKILEEGFILASPVLLILLLTEALLGLFSRFTPQLNAFSISLTIKSSIAFFILSLHFWNATPEKLTGYMTEFRNLTFFTGAP